MLFLLNKIFFGGSMWFFLCAMLIAADQIIKWATVAKLSSVDTFAIWEGVFHLTYIENRGAAFGMFQNSTAILALVTAIAIGIIIYWFVKKTDSRMWLLRLGLIMILSGAVGNLIDRILRGFVVDMFDFRLINFYVFNFADACICVGVAFLAYHLIFLHDRFLEKENNG